MKLKELYTIGIFIMIVKSRSLVADPTGRYSSLDILSQIVRLVVIFSYPRSL